MNKLLGCDENLILQELAKGVLCASHEAFAQTPSKECLGPI